ncbi:hypothetical protein D3C87_1402860 [compost metagenome]
MIYGPGLVPLDPSSILGVNRIGDGSPAFVLPNFDPERLASLVVITIHGLAFHPRLQRGFDPRGAGFILHCDCCVPVSRSKVPIDRSGA